MRSADDGWCARSPANQSTSVSSATCSTWPGGHRRPGTARGPISSCSTGPRTRRSTGTSRCPQDRRATFAWPGLLQAPVLVVVWVLFGCLHHPLRRTRQGGHRPRCRSRRLAPAVLVRRRGDGRRPAPAGGGRRRARRMLHRPVRPRGSRSIRVRSSRIVAISRHGCHRPSCGRSAGSVRRSCPAAPLGCGAPPPLVTGGSTLRTRASSSPVVVATSVLARLRLAIGRVCLSGRLAYRLGSLWRSCAASASGSVTGAWQAKSRQT